MSTPYDFFAPAALQCILYHHQNNLPKMYTWMISLSCFKFFAYNIKSKLPNPAPFTLKYFYLNNTDLVVVS